MKKLITKLRLKLLVNMGSLVGMLRSLFFLLNKCLMYLRHNFVISVSCASVKLTFFYNIFCITEISLFIVSNKACPSVVSLSNFSLITTLFCTNPFIIKEYFNYFTSSWFFDRASIRNFTNVVG